MKPSTQQLKIWDSIKNENLNLLVSAVAGSGKTTTITKGMELIDPLCSSLSLAYNKSIVEELKYKTPKYVDCSTMHSLGLQSVRRAFRKTKISENKTKKIIYSMLNSFKIKKEEEASFVYKVFRLMDLVRLHNINPLDTILMLEFAANEDLFIGDKELEHFNKIFKKSNDLISNEIDFTDMIYQPVRLNLDVKKYDIVFIDEVQDLSVIQQELFKKTIKRNGKFVAVGDPNQAIYGFAGADFNSFQKLKSLDNVKELPLSCCYRCDKSIVSFAQRLVPEIKFSETAGDGVVRNGDFDELRPGDMVLCRNNQPLVEICLMLFSEEKKARIKGRDFGDELISMINKTNHKNLIVSKQRLERLKQKQYDLLKSFGVKSPTKTNSYKKVDEKVSTITEVIFPRVSDTKEAVELLNKIFSDKDSKNVVTLSSIHKAKGLENDRVFVAERQLMPSKFAKTDRELEQEKNLEYVCYTRAKKELIFLPPLNN